MRGRLAYINDLAADAVYHQSCNVNFRTGKQIPKCFQDQDSDGSNTRKTGRPQSLSCADAFLKASDEEHRSDNERMTVNDLITKMKHYLGYGEEAYSFSFMKEPLQCHFGNGILIKCYF